MISGIIKSDSVLIDQNRYMVDGGYILRKRIFPEQMVEITREQFVTKYSDLHPYINTFEIRDMSQGSGQYIDDADGVEKQFSRKAWFSSLNHSLEDIMVIADRRQAAGQIPRVWHITAYRNFILALTDGGLYKFDTATDTFVAVTGSPSTPMYHAVIHREWLFIARGGSVNSPILKWDGTEAAANFTVPNNSQHALFLADASFAQIGNTLIAVEIRNATTGLIKVRYSTDAGVTYDPGIFDLNTGAEGGLPTPSDPRNVLIAPNSADVPVIYISTTNAVWIVEPELGQYALFHDMNQSISDNNGYILALWPSTRRIYINERASLIEIDPSTGETNIVGPEMSTMPPLLPQGLPDDPPRKASGLRGFTYNPNYFFVGTIPNSSSDFSMIMKMTPDHKWYFVQHHAEANMPVRAMMLSGLRLYFAEDISTSANDQARFLDFGGDYAEEGEDHTPWLTMGLPGIDKCYYELLIEAKNLSTLKYVQIGYRTDFNESSTTNLVPITGGTTSPFHRVLGTVPHALGIEAKAIKFIIKLVRDAVDPDDTPQFLNLKIRWRPHPNPVDVYDLTLHLDRGSDRMADLVDLLARLDTSFSTKCAVSFVPSGDSGDTTPLMVIPVGNDVGEKFEQLRNTGKIKLSLAEVTVDDGTGSIGAEVATGFGYMWVVYGAVGAKVLRRAKYVSSSGAFDSWDTAEITGFTNDAGEEITARCSHPTDLNKVYFATKNTARTIRLYYYDGTTLSVVYTHAAFASVTEALISGITMARNSTKVWFTLGVLSSQLVADSENQDFGVYKSTNGTSFARVGDGRVHYSASDADEVWGAGLNGITYDEASGRLWAVHEYHETLWPNSAVKCFSSYSDDDGTTWIDCGVPAPVAFPTHGTDLGGIQGFPPKGPFTHVHTYMHRNFAGSGDPNSSLLRHTSTNPTVAAPTFTELQGPSNGITTLGGHLYSNRNYLIRPEVGTTGAGVSSTDAGTTVVAEGIDWWIVDNASLRYGGWDVHWVIPLFIAVPEGSGGAGDQLRVTVDGGDTWSDFVLPDQAQGAALVSLRY